jgi:BlaI family transcriptional regulator, penicillinase repressor
MTTRPRLTPRELAIMQVVWDRGEATVRDVHEALSRDRKVAYTTVMTLMNILATKGHLLRRQEDRAYVYSAARPRHQVVTKLVRDFLDRVFEGSAQPLLLHLVKHERLTAKDRAELRRLIDDMEER